MVPLSFNIKFHEITNHAISENLYSNSGFILAYFVNWAKNNLRFPMWWKNLILDTHQPCKDYDAKEATRDQLQWSIVFFFF